MFHVQDASLIPAERWTLKMRPLLLCACLYAIQYPAAVSASAQWDTIS